MFVVFLIGIIVAYVAGVATGWNVSKVQAREKFEQLEAEARADIERLEAAAKARIAEIEKKLLAPAKKK